MRPPPPRPNDDLAKRDAQKIAIFVTRSQAEWIIIALGSLPRTVRKPLERTLDQQLCEHREVH
jgi:hypothetical protein